ncbi:SusC/RagA family TonB-linked outer membrane protein [Flagellimonas maritima]|nr:TonB-dependent receptor [Allomuricauda aurantiaca]
MTIKQALKVINLQTSYNFVYQDDLLEKAPVLDLEKGVIKTSILLERFLLPINMTYSFIDSKTIAVVKKSKNQSADFENRDNRDILIQQIITGKVLDTQGRPLPGASIIEKGTTNGTQSDFDGNFSINVTNRSSVLLVSYIGFTPKEIPVGNESELTITLQESTALLDEIVVIGYGSVKKSDLTGSVSSISEEELSVQKTTSVDQLIQGRAAGVQVTQVSAAPGGAMSIRIRGGNSIVGGNEPLYVIDGFPVYNTANRNLTNPLSAIDPNNIQSIEILKDASATAIYGSRGANGVVIITTKSGKKGKGKIQINSFTGVQKVRRELDLMNSQQFAVLANERAVNDGADLPFPDLSAVTTDTDWQDEIFRQAFITNIGISFLGGGDNSTYAINGNFFDQEGIIIDTGFKRASIGLNLDQGINDYLKVVTSINASKSVNDRPETGFGTLENTVNAAIHASPTLTPRQEDGSYTSLEDYVYSGPVSNPLAQALDVNRITELSRLLGTTAIEIDFSEAFKFTSRFGIDYLSSFDTNYQGRTVRFGEPAGLATRTHREDTSYLIELLMDYKKDIGNHDFSATVGFTSQQDKSIFTLASASNFLSDDLQGVDLSAGEDINTPNSGTSKSLLLSSLARINYIYKDKYLFTLTGRADGSSRFGRDRKWGFFPSGSFAWRISNEEFLKDSKTINNLKLRLSYGLSGNQEIGSYQSLERIEANNYILGTDDGLVIGLSPANIGNPDLKWETTSQFNAGLDLGLLGGRVSFVADYYVKNTSDLLVNRPLPPTAGFSSVLENVGEIRNEGFEFAINALPFAGEFSWNIDANISFNRNEVISLGDTNEFFGNTIASNFRFPVNIVREGEELGTFFGYETETLLSETGDIVYADLNDDGEINSDDRTIIGSPYPDFIYGFTSTMEYRNFDLSFFLQGVQGGEIFNFNRFLYANPTGNRNQITAVLDRWTPENQDRTAQFPRVSGNSPLLPSDRFLESASFLRLRNITLGYRIKPEKLKFFSSARFYLTGQNLITISDYSGYDPEVNTFGGGTDLRLGVDAGAYPTNKSYLFGLELEF